MQQNLMIYSINLIGIIAVAGMVLYALTNKNKSYPNQRKMFVFTVFVCFVDKTQDYGTSINDSEQFMEN